MFGPILLLVAAGLVGPLLASTRRPLVPVLVGELFAGAALGRTGLGWLHPDVQPMPAFMTLGLAMLMLQAGTEVDIRSPVLRQRAGRGVLALAITAAVSVPIGLAVSALTGAGHATLIVVLLAGSSAAVAFPTITEQGLTGPAVAMLLAWITLADASTALVMPLTLTGVGTIPKALGGDVMIVAVAGAALLVARRLFQTGAADAAKKMSKARHWALQLRVALLLLLALATISQYTGASLLVAGFAAGIVMRQFHEPHRLVHQLTGLATGFFVPAFFVLLGATLDLRGLLAAPSAIVLAVAMAGGAAIAHVVAGLAAARDERLASGLLSSAQLGLPAAAASLGLAEHVLTPPIAAALVAGGILTLVPATAGAVLLARGSAR
ncbi:MAG TPA: cation:proton antiporter [Candidatus Dormibacteraeota bacterium]